MRTFKLTLAYDGTQYAGWQFQVDQPTVQAVLEAVLLRVTGEAIRTVASGRTDAGVHALGQVVSFQSATHLPAEVLQRAISAYLPPDIVLGTVELAEPGFHAIRQASSKRYRYVIAENVAENLFQRQYIWRLAGTLDLSAMSRAASLLMGEHDFASFASSGSERKSTVRHVTQINVERAWLAAPHDPTMLPYVTIEIEANGFLYNMVRNIVGTLVEVGRGAQPESWVSDVLNARDRRAAGPTAPPQGLFLVRVEYSTVVPNAKPPNSDSDLDA